MYADILVTLANHILDKRYSQMGVQGWVATEPTNYK